MKYTILILAAVFNLGCVFPVYKTLQPYSVITVNDETGNPVNNAEVALVSNAFPYGNEKSRNISNTNEDGIAEFPKISEWRTEALMLHGAELFFWNWCVKKNGYQTFTTRNRSENEFENKKFITLKPGESQDCPEDMYRYAL